MKKSLNASAMSWGLVYVLFSYVIIDGVCRSWFLDGMMVLRILACCLGSCLVSWSCFSRWAFLACVITFLRCFWYCLCAWMLCAVGCASLRWWSLCWRLICFLYLGVHHFFLRGLGLFSCFSIVHWNALSMSLVSWFVVGLGLVVWMFLIADLMSWRIVVLCFS